MDLVMKKKLDEKGYSVVPNILSKSEIENSKEKMIKKELDDKGYCIIPNILSESDIEYSINEFKKWQETIPNHDKSHNTIDPHGIYKYHRTGHTKHAWYIRTRPDIQNIFKNIWGTKELVVSFDGCCYISKENKQKDKIWTHTDQSSKSSDLTCYQGFVSLTNNKERTLVVYEGSHKLHENYFKDKKEPINRRLISINTKLKENNDEDIEVLNKEKTQLEKELKKFNQNWQLIDHDVLEKISEKKRILEVPAGSLVLWDSRTFHQNQYGESESEERMVQYVCYLPKKHPLNSKAMQKKRLKYFQEQRTTSHWPYPIKVNGLQPRTYGDDSKLIDYDSFPLNDLSDLEEEIMKII